MTDPMLDHYFRLMNMNGAANVYREAVRPGLLDGLRAGPQTAAGLAQKCGLMEGPVSLLLDALIAMGLATHVEGGRYGLTPLALALLNGSYRDLGDVYWAHLATFLKTGNPLMAMDSAAQSESHYQNQAAALAWMLAPAADVAAKAIDAGRTLRGSAILDVGAGSAIWSLTLARHAPGARVTAVDWPAVLKVASGTAQHMGLADRMTLLPGNYHQIDLPQESFDLAVLGNVTHLETAGSNVALLTKVRQAIKPGGRLIIFDVLPGLEAGDLNRALYALGLALRTVHGRVYAPGELQSFLTQSGYGTAQLTNLDVPPYAVGMMTVGRD